jgi:hypothetical protein
MPASTSCRTPRCLCGSPLLSCRPTPPERVATLTPSHRPTWRSILEPTLFVVSPGGQPSKAGEWAVRVTARARALGVRIAAGTDGLIPDGETARPNLHEELVLLVRHAGLTSLEAISAATSVAAAALGVQDDRGVLAPGKAADLVVLSRDPLADIRNTRSIEWVMKAGKRYGGATPSPGR